MEIFSLQKIYSANIFYTHKMVLSDFTKGEIIGLYKEKNTQAYISNKLGVSQSTVSITIKKYLETGNTDSKPCLGAKKSFGSSVVNIILQIANKNPKSSLRKIASEVERRTKKYISHVTVRKIPNDTISMPIRLLRKHFS
jgi:transposase